MNTDEKDDKTIIAIQRNEKTGYTEKVDMKQIFLLNYTSHAEINYVIFDVPSTDYLLQLFHQAEDNGLDFKNYRIDGFTVSDIRTSLAHKPGLVDRNSKKSKPVATEYLKKKTINYLRSILIK